MLKVKDHKKFACCDYISDNECENPYSLGDVVTSVSEDGTEIEIGMAMFQSMK
jgi:hypothetical protein